jgi:hypothetical protein
VYELCELTHNINAILDPSHQMLKVGIELLQAARVEEDPALPALTTRSAGCAGTRLGGSAISPTSRCLVGLVRPLYGQLLLMAEDLELGGGKAKVCVRD